MEVKSTKINLSGMASKTGRQKKQMYSMESVLSDIYDALWEIEYPAITNAEREDIETTILTGQERISLLTWLLSNKSLDIANTLKTLEGSALEDALLKYYGEIGICRKKELLLGTCPREEQLPTLVFLLSFIRNMYIESPIDASDGSSENIVDIILKKVSGPSWMDKLKRKMSHAEVVEYFERMRTEVDDYEKETGDLLENEGNENRIEPPLFEKNGDDDDDKDKEIKSDAQLFAAIENFNKAFPNIKSGPGSDSKPRNTNSFSLDKYISEISKQFSNLQEFLSTIQNLRNLTIPEGLPQSSTHLDGIIEDLLTKIEEIQKRKEE